MYVPIAVPEMPVWVIDLRKRISISARSIAFAGSLPAFHTCSRCLRIYQARNRAAARIPWNPTRTVAAVYRFLVTPRWLSLLLIAVLAVPGCTELAFWQLHRLHHAQRHNELIRTNSRGPAVDPASLMKVGGTVPSGEQWRTIGAVGHYDLSHTLLVRNRSRDGAPGFHVLSPLVTAAGPAVLVDRGWVGVPDAGGAPSLPTTATGEVKVTGLLRPTETQSRRGPRDAADVPAGQVVKIDVPRIAATLPYPVYGGYVQLRAQDPPAPVVEGLSSPDPADLPGSDTEMLHLAYASQWFVFAGIGPIGFVLLARREATDLIKSGRTSSIGSANRAPAMPS
jgi:cytochrome oxidase assembly protein ShyY1